MKQLAGRTILVLEDEYFISIELDRILSDAGATVVGPTGHLREAREKLRRNEFEVAVLDVKLNEDMSFGIADELSRREIPFVFATGYDRIVLPPRFCDVPYWRKPLVDDSGFVNGLASLCAPRPLSSSARPR